MLPSATAVAASQGDAAMPMARPVTRQRMPTKRGGLVSRCWMIMRLAVKNAPPPSAIRARPPQQSGEVVAGRAHQCTGHRHHGRPLHEALPAHPLDPPALLRDGQNGEAGIHRRDQAEFLGAHRHLAHERCSGKSSHARLHKLGEPQDENRGVKQPIRCGSGRVMVAWVWCCGGFGWHRWQGRASCASAGHLAKCEREVVPGVDGRHQQGQVHDLFGR